MINDHIATYFFFLSWTKAITYHILYAIYKSIKRKKIVSQKIKKIKIRKYKKNKNDLKKIKN